MINCLSFLIYCVLFVASITTAYGDETSKASFTCTATIPQESYSTSDAGGNISDLPRAANDRPEIIEELINETRANTRAINQLKATLSDLKNRSYTTAGVLNNVLLFTEELIAMHNNTVSFTPLPTSCKDIKRRMPSSPSGVYLIAATAKTTEYVYCNMETLCGSDEGWTRLAHMDMIDPSENCPGGLRLYQANEKRACGRPTSGGGGCHSIKYPSHGVQYSRVCGKAIGYQYASPDAIDSTIGSAQHNDINSYYVDGISLTRGSPRQHIWTLMAGYKEDNSYVPYGNRYTCPCQTGSIQGNNIPSFIGNDYYCESGNPALPPYNQATLYTADPLWDGKQCRGLESPCCVPGLPWFNKQLGTTTSDYIEVRVCSDQSTGNEDAAIEQLEIYVN